MKKKLFISVPMKGRTKENIDKTFVDMHKLAEVYFGEELDVIDTWIDSEPDDLKYEPIWYLGKSIELLANADYYIGIHYYGRYPGCNTEASVAREYGIPSVLVECFDLKSCEDIKVKAEEEEERYL